MHAIEKILAKHAGMESVTTGQIINCDVDLAGINDLYLQTVRSFFEMGATKVAHPDRIAMFLDHYAPASTIIQADNQRQFREFCETQGIEKLMDIDQGVCHQVVADHGWSRPGRVIVITDSHTTTHGAFGAFGTGVGATDLAIILATGQLWFRVPEIIRINFDGKLPEGVYAKDIILHAIGALKDDIAVYKAEEITVSTIAELIKSERMALCNMTTEMGAKACYIQPDAVTMSYLEEKGLEEGKDYEIFHTDADFKYAAEINFDVSNLTPQVAAPFSVDNVFDLKEYEGQVINQAYIGSCTGGRVEDLRIAAEIVKGKHIPRLVRLVVVPASKGVFLEAMAKGYVQTLVEAGATFVTPGCAACLGTHEGMISSGEYCITTTNRNFPGRMGATDGHIFLASPATVAASAINGKITDPTPYLQ